MRPNAGSTSTRSRRPAPRPTKRCVRSWSGNWRRATDMYLPRAFASQDPAALDALLDAHPFVTLVTVADGAPVVSHLPVLHAREGGTLVLRGHWARPNQQSTPADYA